MMGRCAVVGCGMEEQPCLASWVPPSNPAEFSALESGFYGGLVGEGVDLFSQARKALTERSPYDADVSEKDGGQGSWSSMTTLPAGLVGLLAKHTDSRRRHKKSHSGVDSKKKASSRQSRGRNIWIETEVYFRGLTMSDIETLFELCTFLTSDSMNYLSIPAIGDAVDANAVAAAAAASCASGEMTSICGDVVAATAGSGEEMVSIGGPSDSVVAPGRCGDAMVSTGVSGDSVAASCRSGDEMVPSDSITATCGSGDEMVSIGVPSDNVVPTGGSGVEMVIDEEKVTKTGTKNICSGEENCPSPISSPSSSVSIEWVLGSKNKILLASERPSKKRKLLGENAGLEKIIVSQPCEGNPNLCHFCSQGCENSEPSNRLIICSTCGVAVHRKCYGVEGGDIVECSWLCSWCKHVNNSGEVTGRYRSSDFKPCLLCPKQGGALKPLKTNEAGNRGPVKFVHLFCSQWMPEVFIEDTKLMEPIMNVDGIKETRKKLICSICKVKHGACVRCSNGTCRASFHPICAREASHRTEIWGKAGNSDVELRAFCAKHSGIPTSNEDIHQVDSPTSVGGEAFRATTSSAALPNGHYESEFGCKYGDICDIQLEVPGYPRKQNGELVDKDVQNRGVVKNPEPENCSSELGVDAESLKINHVDGVKPSVAFLLKRLIDRGKINMEEIALEMGMPPDSLAATLASGTLTLESQNKAIGWLKSHAYLSSLEKNIRVKIKSLDKLDKETMVLETQVSSYTLHDSIEKDLCDLASISTSMMDPPANGSVTEHENPSIPIGGTLMSDLQFAKEGRPSYVHMSVYGKLRQLMSDVPFSEAGSEFSDCRLNKVARLDLSSTDGMFLNLEIKNSAYSGTFYNNGHESKQLSKAKVLEIFDIAPEDELEGELVYLQHKLLGTKFKRKRFSDGLVSKAVKSLPLQIDFVRSQRWDSVFVNKYLAEVREAKKQGRKEKRHLEAQAVLAAATAAAASSSRISTFRKDDLDESSYQENPSKASHMLRPGSQFPHMPRPKEMISRVALPRVTPETQCDSFQSNSELNKENVRSCDVCRRPETILNSILVCSICKVSVHIDCYHSVKDFTGPWQCELCEDTSSRCTQPVVQNSWENPISSAECVVCGGTVGAFRKSADGQWIHAFCAEWTLQSTFRRGQTDPIVGLESISKGNDACCVCRLKKGVCLKCHYGHCQSAFHASCARSAGFYMNAKSSGSKIQHKAYCEKHSCEQRSKDENQKHGTDELKSVKQVRVELERLRLLCERIVRREKLKRDLLLCSHDILASKRDSVVFSALLRSPYFHPGISSDSATTSLYNSGSEAIQKSDDVTVDSTSSVKKPSSLAGSMENDRKTDDSSTSQLVFDRKNTLRSVPCAGKKIPNRTLSISRNLSDDSANRLKFRKLPETFDKELVMTSDQASMKNQRLPKGFVYVPVGCLRDDKPGNQDT